MVYTRELQPTTSINILRTNCTGWHKGIPIGYENLQLTRIISTTSQVGALLAMTKGSGKRTCVLSCFRTSTKPLPLRKDCDLLGKLSNDWWLSRHRKRCHDHHTSQNVNDFPLDRSSFGSPFKQPSFLTFQTNWLMHRSALCRSMSDILGILGFMPISWQLCS